MASAQRSIFKLTATQDAGGLVTPSDPRELAKGAQLLGVQVVTSATVWITPDVTFLVALQGRNGDSMDDWLVIYQSSATASDAGETFMLGGADVLVPVQQFAELRLNIQQLTGTAGQVTDLQIDAHCKTDYLTG